MPSLWHSTRKANIGLFSLKSAPLNGVEMFQGQITRENTHVTKGSRVFLLDCADLHLLCLPYFILHLQLFHTTNLFNYSSERCFPFNDFLCIFYSFILIWIILEQGRSLTNLRNHILINEGKKCAEFLLHFNLIVFWEQKKSYTLILKILYNLRAQCLLYRITI